MRELTPRDPVAEPVARRRGSRYSAWSFGLLVLCGLPAVWAYLYRSWMLAAVTLGAVVLIFFVAYGSAGYWLGYARALRDHGVGGSGRGPGGLGPLHPTGWVTQRYAVVIDGARQCARVARG